MFKNNISKYINYVTTFLFTFAYSIRVFANGETPVSDGLQYFINAMYGATGVSIATVAVMIVGLLCLGHFIKWIILGYTICGISIIFGAGAIVKGILPLIHSY